MKRLYLKQIISTILFLALAASLVLWLCEASKPDGIKAQRMLYDQVAEDSVDVIFLGSSAVYTFYDVMTIWNDYSITSMTHTAPALSFDYTIPFLKESQKTQSPKLYVIELRSLMREELYSDVFGTHRRNVQTEIAQNIINYLPTSLDKWNFVAENPYLQSDGYHYVFDILYNHAAFPERLDTIRQVDALRFMGNEKMVYNTQDLTQEYADLQAQRANLSVEPDTLSEDTKAKLDAVFQYAKEENLELCFTFSPYLSSDEVRDREIREGLGQYILDNGFGFQDYNVSMEDWDYNPATDFQDIFHVNALGATKFSRHAMDYLIEAYDLAPTDATPAVADSWNQAYQQWLTYDASTKALVGMAP